jgi:hypothetical protein
MRRPGRDPHRIACPDRARRDHPQVGSGQHRLGEPLDPAVSLQPALEGAARDARAGDLEQRIAPDQPALSDQRVADGDALGGQVLTEDAVAQRPAQLGGPGVKVLARVSVDGLVGAAVILHVVDPVPGQADGAGALGPRCRHHDRAGYGPLVDAGQRDRLPRVGARPADVDREQSHDLTIGGPIAGRPTGFRWVPC